MTMNVGAVLDNPRFVQAFQIKRTTRTFSNEGRVSVGAATMISATGVVQPAKRADVLRLQAEGERVNNVLWFMSRAEIRHPEGVDGNEDEIVFAGNTYRLLDSKRWEAFGYSEAWGVEKVRANA
jgi:hypothetical protein